MKCFSPYIKFDGSYPIAFPCGKCLNCRRKKSLEWSFRLRLERQTYTDIAFATLTYSSLHIPSDYSLNRHHIVLFLKRLRIALARRGSPKIRYFCCGEYGTKHGRPHYHLVLFGLRPCDFDLVDTCWGKGFVECEIPKSDGLDFYVAGYVTKKQDKMYYHYKDRLPPFNMQSKGLGKVFVDSLPFYTSALRVGKRLIPLPRFLRNFLANKFGVLEQVKDESMRRLYDLSVQVIDNYVGNDLDKIARYRDNCVSTFREAWNFSFGGHFIESEKILNLHVRKDL